MLRSVLMIALIAVVSYFTLGAGSAALIAAYGSTAVTVGGAIAMMAGMALINALVPPPTPKLGNAAGDPFQQLNSITGTSNQANPYGVIPCVVGTYRFFPCHAALPYTEILGDDQYLRMLLDLGLGDLDISDIQLNGTAIDSFQGVEYEVTTTPTLFTQDIDEVTVGVDLADGANAVRTTQTNTTEISVDLVFP